MKMNLKKITASEITTDFIAAQAADWIAAAKTALDAAEAYHADVKARQQALEQQGKEYAAQLDKLKAERKKLAANVNDLASRCDFDAAEAAELKLEALDKKIASLSRRLQLVNATELKGDPALYKAAKAARDAAEECCTPYRQRVRDLRSIVKDEIKRLEAVDQELYRALDRNHSYYANNSFDKVDRHYRELDRIEREAAEKAAAEYKARQREHGRVVQVAHFD